MAARSIERNYTLKYMERYFTFQILTTVAEPRVINFRDTKVKKIHWIRIPGADGDVCDLKQVDPKDVRVIGRGQPERYWLDGVDFIWFDKIPDQDYPGEIYYDRYTTWPTPADSTTDPPFRWLDSTNWLTDNADDMFVGHTLRTLRSFARLPPDVRQEIDSMVVRGMKELIGADEELRHANTSWAMQYGKVY
jgi:hypothetical protein